MEFVLNEKFDDYRKWQEKHEQRFKEFLVCYVNNNSSNPCTKKGVGFELSLEYIKAGLIMNFHVIIDDTNQPVYEYRMVFQGENVECPK